MKKQYFSSCNLLNYMYLDLTTKYDMKNLFLVPCLKEIYFSQKVHDFNSQIKNEQFSLNFLYFSLFNATQPMISYSTIKRMKKINTATDGKVWKISIFKKKLIDIVMLYKTVIIEVFSLTKTKNIQLIKQNSLSKKKEVSFLFPNSIVPAYSTLFNTKGFIEEGLIQVHLKHKLSLVLRKNKLSNFLIYNEFETFFRSYFDF